MVPFARDANVAKELFAEEKGCWFALKAGLVVCTFARGAIE